MKYLTYLDYQILENTSKNVEAKLDEKDKEMQDLKDHYEREMTEMRAHMENRLDQIMSLIRKNPKLAQVKTEVLKDNT